MKLKTTRRIISFSVLVMLFLVSGCKQNEEIKKEILNLPNTLKLKASIPSYNFDWETADFMPSPVGSPKVMVPWASGSNQMFDSDIASDYKKQDGWVLVYNSFSPDQVTSPNFFTLYNKYSGILRFYLYLPPGSVTPSSYMSDGLEINGNFNSNLMNYSNEITDMNNISNSLTRIQNYKIQSTGAWYAYQYEMAYDETINTKINNFVWNISATNLTSINLNGQMNGDLTGTIGTGSSGGFNLSTLLNSAKSAALYFVGFKGINAIKGLNSTIKTEITNGVKSGLVGNVKSLLNGILGGAPTTPQVVNLTLKSEIELKGVLENNSGIAKPSLIVPGSATSNQVAGIVPNYNVPLGVFYMKSKPKVEVSQKIVYMTTRSYPYNNLLEYEGKIISRPTGSEYGIGDLAQFYRAFRYHKNNKDLLVYNPALINEGVKFEILREDLLVPLTPLSPYWITSDKQSTEMVIGMDSSTSTELEYREVEDMNGQKYAVFGTNVDLEAHLSSWVHANPRFIDNIKAEDACIRYTIRVMPPNGGKQFTIVKTFKADIIPMKISIP